MASFNVFLNPVTKQFRSYFINLLFLYNNCSLLYYLAISDGTTSMNEKTMMIFDMDTAISYRVRFLKNAQKRMDIFTDGNGPSMIINYDEFKDNYVKARSHGAKIRFITEITKHNIHYCKELIKIVDEFRHLEGLKGSISVSEIEYLGTTTWMEKQLLTPVTYSNEKEVVEQQQSLFETLWSKAMPAERKFKEIEEGIEPVNTTVLENQDEIYNHFMTTIKKSKERYACSSIGGMQMIYNNFFNLYKDVVEKQKRGEGNGIKWLTYIDDNKNSIGLVKVFLNEGIQVRHIKNLPPMNFFFDSSSIQATIKRMDEGNLTSSLLISNEPAYVKHFTVFFQELWNNYGIDAVERIKDIEEGMEYDVEVIRHSDRSLDVYLNTVKSAQNEILFIFPTPKAFIRQLKAIDLANQASKERKVKVRILTPSNESIEKLIKSILKEKEEENQENPKRSIASSLSNTDIEVRYIEKMSHTKATILVVDRKESLVMELQDDTKDTFEEAIGLSVYSNSKPWVLSYVAIFENLWKQAELFDEIKRKNKDLEKKTKELRIKKEELHSLVNKLVKDDKAKNEFIAMISHELLTPLVPIKGYTEMLLQPKILGEINENQNKAIQSIKRNVEKQESLVRDILDSYTIEVDKFTLSKKRVMLSDLFDNIISDVKPVSEEKEVSIISEINTRMGSIVYCDEKRIEQVLSNLIKNSIDFVPIKGGKITLRVEEENQYRNSADKDLISNLLFTIEDNGKGIPDDKIDNLFNKFYQIDTSVTRKHSGIGIGLAICKGIVEAHGGKIWIDRYSKFGTIVKFTLPKFNYTT